MFLLSINFLLCIFFYSKINNTWLWESNYNLLHSAKALQRRNKSYLWAIYLSNSKILPASFGIFNIKYFQKETTGIECLCFMGAENNIMTTTFYIYKICILRIPFKTKTWSNLSGMTFLTAWSEILVWIWYMPQL